MTWATIVGRLLTTLSIPRFLDLNLHLIDSLCNTVLLFLRLSSSIDQAVGGVYFLPQSTSIAPPSQDMQQL